jgi:transmembrane sensor
MEKSNFDQLLNRYLTGEVSEQEKAKLEAWLEVVKTDDHASLEISKEDEEKLFHKITANVDNLKDVVAFRPDSKTKDKGSPWLLKIAAGLIIVALASFTLWYATGQPDLSRSVASAGSVDKVILDDGSLVWLRGESHLAYFEKPNGQVTERSTHFHGEALFEVAKDASRPFIIQCGEVKIRVVGTSFNIKMTADNVELSVLTGSVTLSTSLNDMTIDASPNERVIYRAGKFEKLPLDPSHVSTITSNTEYNMRFSNSTLSDVAEKLEDKFDVAVKYEDTSIKKCRITADFTDQSLDKTLQVITEVLDVEYSLEEDVITFSGKGCQ